MKYVTGAILVAVLLVLVGLGWATRWRVIYIDKDARFVYLLNRWTDEMRVVSGAEWAHVQYRAPRVERREEPAPSR